MIENELTSPTAVVEMPSDPAELRLVNEVGQLWLVHTKARTSLHQTRDDLKSIRTDLSGRLHQLKSVLSRPGRGGAWSSFLQAQKIPRSTADRLVRGHEKTISADRDSCTGEQFKEPIEVAVRRYFHALWPRLSRILTTSDAVHVFIVELHRAAEKSFAQNWSAGYSSAKKSDPPSYLMHLDPPVVQNSVAHV
jgi:hypothetical protein